MQIWHLTLIKQKKELSKYWKTTKILEKSRKFVSLKSGNHVSPDDTQQITCVYQSKGSNNMQLFKFSHFKGHVIYIDKKEMIITLRKLFSTSF